jgi:outer membrane lipoprotein-sorting protein
MNFTRILLFLLLLGVFTAQAPPKRVSSDVTIKKYNNGKLITYQAEVFYKAGSGMITVFKDPLNYILVTDVEGNIRIYNPKSNTVNTLRDPSMSSNTSIFYNVLSRKSEDLGLKSIGFVLDKSEIEEGHSVTWWRSPEHLEKQLKKVKIVHKDGKPVYTAYYRQDDKPFKRTFYGKGAPLQSFWFPDAITEVTYTNPTYTDSMVEKTYYTNLKYNEAANSHYFDFKIPASATIY